MAGFVSVESYGDLGAIGLRHAHGTWHGRNGMQAVCLHADRQHRNDFCGLLHRWLSYSMFEHVTVDRYGVDAFGEGNAGHVVSDAAVGIDSGEGVDVYFLSFGTLDH